VYTTLDKSQARVVGATGLVTSEGIGFDVSSSYHACLSQASTRMSTRYSRRGSLLFDDPPIAISPTLAKAIGLSEAIILQQIHYWLVRVEESGGSFGRWHEERFWIYNTYETWQEQFPFWSVPTIKRTMKSLEEMGLILTATLNRAKMDRTKWYTIDYNAVEQLKSSLR
jgi:hypothetical protein